MIEEIDEAKYNDLKTNDELLNSYKEKLNDGESIMKFKVYTNESSYYIMEYDFDSQKWSKIL